MKDYLLNFPEDYEEYAWDVEQKGWFSAATLKFSGKGFRLNFYDPTRLAHEIKGELDRGRPFFFEPNLIVVDPLTRANMENAVARLVELGDIDRLIAE